MSSNLEDLYSPSKWAKLPADEVLKQHVEFATKETKKVREHVPFKTISVESGIGFDIYGNDLPDDSSVFIYIHGGYWQELHKDVSAYPVAPLYKNKIKTVLLGYNLCPKVGMVDIVNEIKATFLKAIPYIAKAKNIAVGGHSAGAHLAISLLQKLTENKPEFCERIQDLYLISGVFDLTPLVHTSVNDALKMTEDLAKSLSPLFHNIESHDKLHVHVFVGEHDSPAFKQQSEDLHKKIESDKIKSEFAIIPAVDHFDIVENLSQEDYVISKNIIKALLR